MCWPEHFNEIKETFRNQIDIFLFTPAYVNNSECRWVNFNFFNFVVVRTFLLPFHAINSPGTVFIQSRPRSTDIDITSSFPNRRRTKLYLLALVESLAAVLLEILVSFFLGATRSRSWGGAVSRCSMSELPPLVLGLSSGLCTSLDILALEKQQDSHTMTLADCRVKSLWDEVHDCVHSSSTVSNRNRR